MIPKMGKKAIETLGKNLRQLVGEGRRYPTLEALAARSGVGKSTIARARNGENALRIDNLEDIARAFNLEPWQMLVDNVDPTNPPSLIKGDENPTAWPFAGVISQAEYQSLPNDAKEAIREFVEMKARNANIIFRRKAS